MKLVPNAKQSWKWLSVQLATLSGIIPGAWLAVPEDMRAAVPPEWLAYGAIALSILIVLGRLKDQGGANE